MTDAIYVRRLPHFQRPTPDLLRTAGAESEPALVAAPVNCRAATVRVNLVRVLADLEAEARRLLGGALCD